MKCILCNGAKLNVIDKIAREDLIALYKRAFGIDTSAILTQDLHYWHCESCDLLFFALENGEIPTGSDDFYTALIKESWYYLSEKAEYDFARKFIKDGDKVLEVGCGAGVFAKKLPESCEFVGLEFSTHAKKLARKNGINILNMRLEDFARENQGRFNVACSFQVLEHVANPREFLDAQISALAKNAIRGGGSRAF